ncbi:2,5-didehydrogluconate reductase (2-dehydro-L-gulonate-forming) [Alteripontixanthobacter maritimus]|uniref:2,5-didehydrogluconate reductase (2-dehydro-L-gulonate-forming) n=1 Tax=Alteripontixanthobacter maritimus TaxID=2161824 RepID=A0A369Q8A8_9SPHN|nr:aldo/keto reductase [Alteripontixanthobacter maritimus]RDC60590.1 2,5-didehydrogluconate reductase (2-dehydro-L-gulonate-forming) [Alteripontixanthobacter maritimus]
MTDYPTLMMNDDRQIPQLGFGTYQIDDSDAAETVQTALDTGYWLIDTAAIYKNERGVGEGIGDWADIFLTTKIWNESQGYDRTKKAFAKCLERLGRDYVDLLLIHWPCPEQGLAVETWKAFIELREEGLAKSIGVSNFREEDLQMLASETGIVPAVNQIEIHPSFQQRDMRKVHDDMGIITQSWSPLGQGAGLKHDAIKRIAEELGQPASAVVLRWHMQCGLAPIPKASSQEHIEANFRALDFELSDEQMNAIDDLDQKDGRIGPDPAEFN